MLHFGIFDIRTDVFVLIISTILLLLQVLLCFKAKNKQIRLIPVYLFSSLTVIFLILAFIHNDWNRLGYLVLAALTAILIIVCCIGWLVYLLINRKK
jgi:phosphoglycerol transferase MdoB-like AlkP superfamily enzyme